MYCSYCRKKGMLGATRCSQCGRPLTHGSNPYDTGGSNGGKVALISLASVAVVLLLVVVLGFSGGSREDRRPANTSRREPQTTQRTEKIEKPSRRDPEEEITIRQTEPTVKETEPAQTEPVETAPKETEPEYTRKVEGFSIYSFKDLKEKLGPDCIDENVEASFHYLGNEGELNYEDVCHILGARAAYVNHLGSGEYEISALPYAGARILKAYRSGNTSSLSADELATLQRAEQIVSDARRTANSDWELELLLHDWMCENISYYDVDFTIEFTEKRPLNVIGALLDGKANCQGYTDCFYLLGNMAGFVVDKQSEDGHTFNTIKQGGNWYIVDVTHDDVETEILGNVYHYYQFLNVGLSDCDGRTWKSYTERNPVAQNSGSYFYYEQMNLGPEHSYQKSFYSLQEAARSILAEYQNGRQTHQVLVRGMETNYDAMNSTLNQEADRMGISYHVWTWSKPVNGNTYFIVYFE